MRRTLLISALSLGIGAIGFAQDMNTCTCDNPDSHIKTRVVHGNIVQEGKHTINVITPAPHRYRTTETTVTTYKDGTAVRTDRNTTGDVDDMTGYAVNQDNNVVQNSVPDNDQTYSRSTYYTSPSDHHVKVRTLKDGTIVETDHTTINKIKPAPMSETTTVEQTTTYTR